MKISAPVDLIYDREQILVRGLPGTADLENCSCEPLAFNLEAELANLRATVARDELPELTILKATQRGKRFQDRGKSCRASFDLALGGAANFVVLDIKGEWMVNELEARIEDAAAQIHSRLEEFGWDAPHRCLPNLCYVSGEHPSYVQLEVTTHCNLRCGYCNNRLLSEKRHTSFAEIVRILEQIDFSYVTSVNLTGLGEPLLHPRLSDIVAEISRRGVRSIAVVSNGTVATVDKCRPLFEAGLTRISISLDSLDPARFRAARAGGNLEIVRGNVIKLANFRHSNAEAHFALNLKSVLLTKDPYDEADGILEFSAAYGLDKPSFTTLDPRPLATRTYEPTVDAIEFGREPISAFLAWVNERWRKLTGCPAEEKAVPATKQKSLLWLHPSLREERDFCDWVVDSAYIGGDGFCIPCCEQMSDLPRRQIGSIFEKPLAALWNKELLYAYRLPLSVGLLPPNCEGCTFAPVEGEPLLPPELVNAG